MLIDKISIGKNPPEEFNVIIEIPLNYSNVKYELDKDSGALLVDRFMFAGMSYPANYGFIPHTLSGDGDPVDVLVLSNYEIIAGAVIPCRAIGVLIMEDESGVDEKIIALPTIKIDPSQAHIESLKDVNQLLKDRITHFFENYKKLEKNKWVKITGWGDKEQAIKFIEQGIARGKS